MNLLAQLERRPPPAIPPGVGRVHSADSIHQPAVKKSEIDAPSRPDMKKRKAESRAAVLKAIRDGKSLVAEIKESTGLCCSSISNHARALIADDLIGSGQIRKTRYGANIFYFPKTHGSQK